MSGSSRPPSPSPPPLARSTSSNEMENNPQQTEIRIVQDEVEVIATSLQSMELTTPSKPRCCIFKVPNYIKQGKDKCYRPSVISIGPVFYKDEKLKPMQELKQICLKSFREHPGNVTKSFEPCIKFVRDHEGEIRDCYDEQIHLPESNEFVKMVVLDAAFLIYYFLLNSRKAKVPNIGEKLKLLNRRVANDLLLEENQLPFFVLKGIFNTSFNVVDTSYNLVHLALVFISGLGVKIPGSKVVVKFMPDNKEIDASRVKHLVDLHRMCCCSPIEKQRRSKGKQIANEATSKGGIIDAITRRMNLQSTCCCWHIKKELKQEQYYDRFDSAKKLIVAGVKFELSQSDDLLDITFDKRKGVLKIPKLNLADSTELLLRSILFFEQCHYPHQLTFCDYIVFLNTLVDSVEDIQVLQKNAIVRNILGSDEDVVDLINQLAKNIRASNPIANSFSDVSKDLKEYTSNPCNTWMAILWSTYFNHPWAIISVIFAVMLFILTLLQTIASFTIK